MPSTAARPGSGLPRRRLVTTLAFVAAALAVLPLADLQIGGHDPWAELGQMGRGLLSPDFSAITALSRATGLTFAFAVCGVTAGAMAGALLAPFYRLGFVRWACMAVRSIHELFWAILLMQITGLSATTGVLALAIPYAGIFAKVYSEYLEESDSRPSAALPGRPDRLSVFLFARLPLVLREWGAYTLYRLECGLRSSAVMGFVGLPTLGFELDTFLRQGIYGAVAAVLIVHYTLIAGMKLWMRWRLLPGYVLVLGWLLSGLQGPPVAAGALTRFLTRDIVPAPLRQGDLTDIATWQALGAWARTLLVEQAVPGLGATMVVAQLSLVLAGVLAILGVPLILAPVIGRIGAGLGHLGLVIGRSTPEYMLAYILLHLFGPSMLPAILALGLHNGAIIAHLLGRQAQGLHATLRPDAPRGIDLYAWEILPRIHANFLALCLYRWEIIVRESALVGLLGVGTLGFHVAAAIQEIRLDRAVFLLLFTMLATVAIDAISRRSRAALRLDGLRTRSPALSS